MIIRMRKFTSSTFLWMGLLSIGLLLFTLTCANATTYKSKLSQEDETESPTAFTTTGRQEAETTDSPNFPYQYDDTEELESVTDDETLIPTTTLKAARNFGNRIRGINSLPNNANSVDSLASSNRNLTHSFNSNLNSNNVTSFPFLRPRPTTSSVISYNPTQYNRVMKRRKNSTVSSLYPSLSTAATFTTPSLLTYLSSARNGSTTSSSRNTIIKHDKNNRRGSQDEDETNTTMSQPPSPSPTLPTTSSQQLKQNLSVNRSSSSANLFNKLYIRKRPRPITLNDGSPGKDSNEESSSETTLMPPTTTMMADAEAAAAQDRSSEDGEEDSTTTVQPAVKHFNGNNVLRHRNPSFPTTGRPLIFNGRRIKVKLVSPTPSPSVPEAATVDVTGLSVKALEAQPGSHVLVSPASSLSFEFNPSVSVQDGIYKFRYSDIKPTVTSRIIHSEDFGVSHVTYGHDHDEDDAATTFSPPLSSFPDDDKTTNNPFNIDIDGSEEEFTSSLPPSYREFLDSNDEDQVRKPYLRNAADENIEQRARPEGQQVHASSITVTVTHTITAGDNPVEPTRILHNSSENKLSFDLHSNHNHSHATGTDGVNQSPNRDPSVESGVKDGNSLPNTIPIVVEQFNSSNAINTNVNQHQLQRQEHSNSNEENTIRATPALPPVPTQSSTWIKVNTNETSFVEGNNEISKNVLGQATATGNGNGLAPAVVVDAPGNKSTIGSPLPAEAAIVPSVSVTDSYSSKIIEQHEPEQGQGRHQIVTEIQIQNISTHQEDHHVSHSAVLSDKESMSIKNSESPIEITPTVSSKMVTSVFYTKHENPHYTTSSYSYTSSTEYSYGEHPQHPHGQGHDHHDDEHSHFDHEHDSEHMSSGSYGHELDHDSPYGHGHGNMHSNDSQHPIDNSQKQQELRPTTTSFWDSLGRKSVDVASTLSSPLNRTNDHHYNVGAVTPSDQDQDLGYSTPEIDTEYPPFSLGDIDRTTPMPESNSPDHSEADNEIDDGHAQDSQSPVHHHDNSSRNQNHSNSHDHGGSSPNDEDGVVLSHPNYSPGNHNRHDKDRNKNGGHDSSYNEIDPDLPTVPVYIQVLLDMPAVVFCTSVPLFKDMVVKVYAAKVEVTRDQVVVFNELKCSNLTWDPKANPNNQSHQQQSGKIKYATTTASVARTISSTDRSIANQNQRRHSSHNPIVTAETTPPSSSSSVGIDLGTSLTKPTTATDTGSRRKRHDQDPHLSSDENSIQKKNFADLHESGSFPDDLEIIKLYPVFFYLTDKNGSYNQYLTESFIEIWNTSKATSNTMFFDKVKKVEMVTPTEGIIGHPADNENSGIIAAITIASIAAVCLFLLGVLLLVMRHRQAQSKFAKRCTPVSLDDYSLDNISVYNSFRRKQRKRTSARSYTNAAFDDANAPSRPCNAAVLTTVVGEPLKLEEEFRALPSVSPTMDDIPAGAETKNRYANVIPMPDTRVLLTFQEDVPNSDYINANFVRGPMGSPKGYIITQGPLEETIVDFWRMVWEQQIRVIMMLTDFSEAGVSKCAEYYPRSETVDSSQLHGDYQITLEKRDITENCITSYLVIKDMERNLRRDVIHLWYHSWPEKGVPVQSNSTVDFLTKSRKFTKEPTPVLVHCSPGTGRSGTLVACDIAMKEFDSQHSVNIPRTVGKIRQDRAGAVQTKEQYLHIYQVVQYYASRLSATPLDSI